MAILTRLESRLETTRPLPLIQTTKYFLPAGLVAPQFPLEKLFNISLPPSLNISGQTAVSVLFSVTKIENSDSGDEEDDEDQEGCEDPEDGDGFTLSPAGLTDRDLQGDVAQLHPQTVLVNQAVSTPEHPHLLLGLFLHLLQVLQHVLQHVLLLSDEVSVGETD